MTGVALIPLDTHTLPGWPTAENPSGLYFFVLLIAVPVLIAAILAALVTGSTLAKRNRATSTGEAPAVLDEGPTGSALPGGSGAAAALPAEASAPTATLEDSRTAEAEPTGDAVTAGRPVATERH